MLSQKVEFSWELIVADDCSTDGTRECLLEYKQQFPHLIRLILQPKNVGAGRNWRDLLLASEARYIAYLEGDDYWTDTGKLAKQVLFLEGRPDFVLSFGNAYNVWSDGSSVRKLYLSGNESRAYEPHEMIELGCPSLTMVYRNFHKDLPSWLFEAKSGDYFLRLLLSLRGKAFFHGDVFGNRNCHSGGISKLNDKLEWFLNSGKYLKEFERICLKEQVVPVHRKTAEYHLMALFSCLAGGRYGDALKIFLKVVGMPGFYTRKGLGCARSLFLSVIIKKDYTVFNVF